VVSGRPPPESAYEALPPKRRLFVDCYIAAGFNATEGARRAHYKQPHSQGPRLLENVEIRAALRERLAAHKLAADEVLARIAAKVDGDMTDFLEVKEGKVRLDIKKARRRGKGHLLRKLEVKDGQVVRLELYNTLDALELLGRALGLFEKDKAKADDDIDLSWDDGSGEEEGEAEASEASPAAAEDR
jgi:phage terminase small subunit